jgi:hypothetical protein
MQQILTRTEPLCRVIAPSATGLRLFPTPICVHDAASGLIRHLWLVNCGDAAGRYAAYLVWDADNGDLLLASSGDVLPLWDRKAALNRREAAQVVRRWMSALGFTSTAQQWRLTRAPMQRYDTWRFHMQSGDCKVIVAVYALSGDLVMARSKRLHADKTVRIPPVPDPNVI